MWQKVISIFVLVGFAAALSLGQNKYKPWVEWSKKDAEKILNDSPWGQTQTETDTSNLFFTPQPRPTASSVSAPDSSTDGRGNTYQATTVRFRIRFLSAKPVRQAVARLMEIENQNNAQAVRTQMRDFIDRRFTDWIAVSVTFDTRDPGYRAPVQQAFDAAVTDVLKNKTYLERKDGRRLFLQIYRAPTHDGLGAKFIFPRNGEGGAFLNVNSGEVRFVSEVSKEFKLDRRFKVADMMYEGHLEY